MHFNSNHENSDYIEQQYQAYLINPNNVSKEWQQYFLTIKSDRNSNQLITFKQSQVKQLIAAYRQYGHLQSNINPLNSVNSTNLINEPRLELKFYGLTETDLVIKFDAEGLPGEKIQTLQEIIYTLQKLYCQQLTIEYGHISNTVEQEDLQKKFEQTLIKVEFSKEQKWQILQELIKAENLEKYLGNQYPGAKRFSLEGSESLLVALDTLLYQSANSGIQEIVLGMAHRGRLNVLVNIMGKLPETIYAEFAGKQLDPNSSGDVKYHQGFTTTLNINQQLLKLSLAFNPSHLELVFPVVMGNVWAKQQTLPKTSNKKTILPVVIHGDAAFAGEGIVMEAMNMAQTRGYHVAGTLHIILNNQIGFTTSNPADARSTQYCTAIGKMLEIPILHVNADDPEAVVLAIKIALDYRNKFQKDVIINLCGYRRHGHSEADEPAVTQPKMYQIIRQLSTVAQLYTTRLIAENNFLTDKITAFKADYLQLLAKGKQAVNKYQQDKHINKQGEQQNTSQKIIPKLSIAELKTLANKRDKVPNNFTLHSLVQKIIAERQNMSDKEIELDWGYAETLAYATLLIEGYMVRLSGQDSSRGTFFHRHAIWYDQQNAQEYIALNHLEAKQEKFFAIDSILAEAAVLAFEYGCSLNCQQKTSLIIWEAQFGDFVNNAQAIIDQFISSAERKWQQQSNLVIFLPHGYEGQGPEHSSARIERLLQLCAEENLQICIPTTPAQLYHLLRQQVCRPIFKPLVVITPKSLLRQKIASSKLIDLAEGKFYPILTIDRDQVKINQIKCLIICSGKLYYEILTAYTKQNRADIAIIRIEQLYPFPKVALKSTLMHYAQATRVIWGQEEPKNQGAWQWIKDEIIVCLASWQKLEYIGREAAAVTATGYAALHHQQQQEIIRQILL